MRMITYKAKVTPQLRDLLLDLQELDYGEAYNVELDGDDRPPIEIEVTSFQNELVKIVENGVASFRTIKVSAGQPTYVEITGSLRRTGFSCKQMFKLN